MKVWLKWLLALAALSALIVASGWYYVTSQIQTFLHQPVRLKQAEVISVQPGTSLYQLTLEWQQHGWLAHKDRTRWLLWQQPKWRKIRAGSYQIQPNWDLAQALSHLIQGSEHQYTITFVEGSRWRDWLAQLEQAPQLTQLNLVQQQSELLQHLEIEAPLVEGWLYPDTYFYTAGTSAFTLIQRAHTKMKKVLQEAWSQRDASVNRHLHSPYEALILASIIEKETGQASERPLISSVFHNRFQKRMRLQTDPTVIYGIGESFNGNITKADLRRKTPYNTYRIHGLPPTPIAMPGKQAIQAALQPEPSRYYYFVSRGDGSHVFASSLKEHNANVRQYILKQESASGR